MADYSKYETPIFQVTALNCQCVIIWVTREPVNPLVGQIKAYELAQIVDWTNCEKHNPDLKEKKESDATHS